MPETTEEKTLPERFHIPLHVHTEFSLLDGQSRVEDICKKAAENNMPGIAITDHGTMFGVYRFYNAAKKAGIKPIIGCEVYIVNQDHREKGKRTKLFHLVLLAKNDKGYQNLIKIVSESCIHGFYYKPRISKEYLKQYSSDLVALSACLGGEVNNNLLNSKYEEAKAAALEYRELFGEDFYLEIQDHQTPEDRQVNPLIVKLGKELGIKVVATNDSHYTNKEDATAHDALLCLQTQKFIADFPRMKFTSTEFLRTEEEMLDLFADHLAPEDIEKAVLESSAEIFHKIQDYELLANPKMHMPDPKVPEGFSFETYLEHITYEGAKKRFNNEITPAIDERLKHELKIMNGSGFPSYFIVVWDFINWARENSIPVGPGRGSAAGSLVAFCLGITNIDPLKYDLLFERFLNPERKSMPDIDTDFCIEGREKVIEYVTEKYGKEQVCQIITFNRLTSKSVIKDMGRVLEYPYARAEELAKMIPVVRGKPRDIAWMIENHDDFKKKYNGDIEAREVIDLAMKNQGINKTFGVHAAGVIISDNPVDTVIPISKSNDGNIITQFPMEEAADMGLLKMDFLGLRNLTMIKNAIDIIHENQPAGTERIDIDSISMEDEKTFDTVCSGNLSGIFQLETSAGMKQIARQLAPRSLEDISALIALYRPGPLDTGMIDEFIDRKSGKKEIKYDHPLLEPILKNTYGTIVYQEQIMQISQALAGFTLGEADLLRRAMGKKKPEVLMPFKDKFLKGCKANAFDPPVPLELGEKLFEQMLAFAEYCFNKSHSTAYGYVTYQTAYLKSHYPVEYLTSLFMSCKGDTDRIKGYIIEAARLEYKVVPPDVNLSKEDFRAVINHDDYEKSTIVFGLNAIKGVGAGPSRAIIEERESKGNFKDFYDLCKRVDLKTVNKKTMEALIMSGAMDSLGAGRKAMMENLEEFTSHAKRSQEQASKGQTSLFAALASGGEDGGAGGFDGSPQFVNGKDSEFSERELQAKEYEHLGLYVSNHPMQGIKEITKSLTDINLTEAKDKKDGSKVTVAALITDFVKKITKSKNAICILNLEDEADRIEGVVFSKKLAEYESMIDKGKRVLIKGTLSKQSEGDASLLVDSIKDLEGMSSVEFEVNVDQLQDYFMFFQEIRSFLVKPENQGSHVVVFRMRDNAGNIRRLALGGKFTMADVPVIKEGLQTIIDRSCMQTASVA